MARQPDHQSENLNTKLGVDQSKAISKDRTYITAVDQSSQQLSPLNSNRLRSPIPFEKQLPRPDLLSSTDVNPLRFVPFNNDPLVSSRVRKINVPRMKLYMPRGDIEGAKDLSEYPRYTPNEDFIRKKAHNVVAFDKRIGRGERKSPYANIPIRNPDFNGIYANVPSFSLDKESPRPQHNKLPSFMLRGTFRNALNVMNSKGLDMNGFSDRGFLPLSSSFGLGYTCPEGVKATPVKGKFPRIVKVIKKKIIEALNSE